uniref:DNA-directed DNA polymerase n=1 Tax=Tanacetum cinerariifolium TaxID=118510 RepID=A0A6L2NTJ1_TANCI|nr:DNA-directed DNA polymerase [Tanacetum cinerariifolium]
MCDASDYAMETVLGQRVDKKFQPICYASKTMNDAQEHYIATKKELLDVIYAFDKFSSYLGEKGDGNQAADHLSILENPKLEELDKEAISDSFPDEHLMAIQTKDPQKRPMDSTTKKDEQRTKNSSRRVMKLKFWHRGDESRITT